MEKTRIIICSDLHLCDHPLSGGDPDWHGQSAEARMDNFVEKVNRFHAEKPCEKLLILGDCSLDHEIPPFGTLARGFCGTEAFLKDYAFRLPMPCYLAPGNHEQYDADTWLRLVGTPRQDAFLLGGYLFILCDNFVPDPAAVGNGFYDPTDLDFVREQMARYPDVPVILAGHFFSKTEEPPAFFDLLREEKRIVCLFCGHDHRNAVTVLGEGLPCLYHDGHYSYSGHPYVDPTETMFFWGFCEVLLSEEGVEVSYVEPANTLTFRGETLRCEGRERNRRFFPRRDR